MDVTARHNVRITGRRDGRPLVFAHGFGCDQNMWRLVAPAFEDSFQVILFDYVGSGGSDVASYDATRYASLDGYAADVVEILDELDLRDAIFVGHSVSSMIGVLAAARRPERFGKLVLIGPSPRYIDDAPYVGGFTADDIDELLESLSSNYLGWSRGIAPAIIANADRPELAAELTESFCRTDPDIARQFARATFLSDNRADLALISIPTLILQCSDDIIAPEQVGAYVHDAMAQSTLVHLAATGHCPHLSAPDETTAAIAAFVRA